MQRLIQLAIAATLLLWLAPALATGLDGIRGPVPVTAEPVPPPLPRQAVGNDPMSHTFPEQPPTMPHPIRDDYQFGFSDNRCLLCHSRTAPARVGETTHAPKVSESHLLQRDGRAAAEVTPGRRFCVTCHVPQAGVLPPVGNSFHYSDGKAP